MIDIVQDDLESPETLDLLAIHLSGMHANSPPGHVFALDLSGLKRSDVTVWTARRVAGVVALRDLGGGIGELKSMRVHPDCLRHGVGAALLEHVVREANRRGYHRLSLETGSGSSFEAAIALYRKRGFVDGPAFGDYTKSEFNQFLHLELR